MKSQQLWFLLACLLSACARLSPEQCMSMDWSEKGKVDGMHGESANAFNYYAKLCSEHGIAIDQASYTQGRTQGLHYFCTEEQGRSFARRGGEYNGVCPLKLEPDFLKGYYLGQKEYELAKREEELDRRAQELSDQQARLRAAQMQAQTQTPAQTPTQVETRTVIITDPRQCTFNSDCVIPDSCTFFECNKTGRVCNFDSDCRLQGSCYFNTCSYK